MGLSAESRVAASEFVGKAIFFGEGTASWPGIASASSARAVHARTRDTRDTFAILARVSPRLHDGKRRQFRIVWR